MFDRELQMISLNNFKTFQNTNVLIIGLGGVGGIALEMLVRSGFINITLIDNDLVYENNLNRQILYCQNDINNLKVEVAKNRAKSINPKVKIKVIDQFLDIKNFKLIMDNDYDYIIDACDTITTKIEIIKHCLNNHIKFISVTGTGNRTDSSKVTIKDIWETKADPVAKILRSLLRKSGISDNFKVIYSDEAPIKNRERNPGSIAPVTNTAGILCANYIINDILKNS